MRSLTVQIPKPCHENWDQMPPNERGRFCASCQKTVVDYSNLSDQELVRLLNKVPEASCGRLRQEQLDRLLVAPGSNYGLVWRRWVSLLTMGLLGWQSAQAQVNQGKKTMATEPASQRPVLLELAVKNLPIRAELNPTKELIIRGRVMLADSVNNLSPVYNANVMTIGGATKTDSTGAFTLQTVVKENIKELPVQMHASHRILERVTITLEPATKSIELNTIVLYKPAPMKEIIGGGLAIIKPPTRWQKLKRKLFHHG
ncbi:hypothetical protein WBJ53_20680 [Spirosoma sp. SC4-14]|uniref:hypothetical protein n=1 Tax=Spirosoma sp. SC4-14 TaxID=3128900 RepID=UPI0030CBFDC2